MNTFVLLPLKETMAQRGAGKHDQWRGYMTILVINHQNGISISILAGAVRPIITFDVDIPWDGFFHDVQWTLAIC